MTIVLFNWVTPFCTTPERFKMLNSILLNWVTFASTLWNFRPLSDGNKCNISVRNMGTLRLSPRSLLSFVMKLLLLIMKNIDKKGYVVCLFCLLCFRFVFRFSSLVCLFICLVLCLFFVRLFARWLLRSLFQSFVRSYVRPFVRSFVRPFAGPSFVHPFFRPFVHSSVHSSVCLFVCFVFTDLNSILRRLYTKISEEPFDASTVV